MDVCEGGGSWQAICNRHPPVAGSRARCTRARVNAEGTLRVLKIWRRRWYTCNTKQEHQALAGDDLHEPDSLDLDQLRAEVDEQGAGS
eukprot:9994551-Alexandrium_andersonii.AAC.1